MDSNEHEGKVVGCDEGIRGAGTTVTPMFDACRAVIGTIRVHSS